MAKKMTKAERLIDEQMLAILEWAVLRLLARRLSAVELGVSECIYLSD
jgi:hypothetical protein